METDSLDEKLNDAFEGRCVRKDLVQQLKKGTNIPTFVLEFLLARFCASDDPDEIAEGKKAVTDTIQSQYVRPNESNSAQTRVKLDGTGHFIDKVKVIHNEKEKRHWAELQNFGSTRVAINERHYTDNQRLLEGGLWCEVTVGYNSVEDDNYTFYVEDLRPIQISRFSYEDFVEMRKEFTRDEWQNVILRSVGLEPEHLTVREQLHFLARLIPLVEQNYNFLELGPRGTGKSYVYSEFTPYSTLLSGGQTTTATLFYNKVRKEVGIIGFWDTIAFDEVAGIKVKDPGTITILKDYMANGHFNVAAEVIAPASLTFVGNIDDSIEQLVNSETFDLCRPLPKEFDLAIIHRFHCYVPGWEIPANSSKLLTDHYGLITDYLAEAFHHLFGKVNLFSAVKERAKLNSQHEGRDETGVIKTVAGLIKLLHPGAEPTDAEFEEYLRYAIEIRRRVKEQLNKRKSDDEFANINLGYFNALGEEIIVDCPETRGVAATLNPSRVTLEDSLEPAKPRSGASAVVPSVTKSNSPSKGTDSAVAILQEKRLTIRHGDTGYGYRSIFGDYLVGAKKLHIVDPYIRKDYQLRNLISVCELAADIGSIKEIELVTALEHETHREEIESKFESLQESLADLGIEFSYTFDESIHDREIVTDTGWHIGLGRGLDIYQPLRGWINIGVSNLDLRPCKETTIHIFCSNKIETAAGTIVEVATERTIADLIKEGEGPHIEFKSTLRTNLHTGAPDKKIEQTALKTIAAFLNSEGGTLLIGVNDDGETLGIGPDKFPDEDQMNLHLVSLIKDRIGAEHTINLTIRFINHDDKRVFRVDCRPSNFPCYFRDGDNELFYIRTGAATINLKVSQCQSYQAERFK
ncbi:BREX system Lon protease-like protein BrxL [Verrucomicrobiales bacterium]|nr:BREX system Lon protease-like protein BrxL [Verrucomicrobiales bacterium]